MRPLQLFDPASSTYTYLVFDEATRDAIIIDPVDEQTERDLDTLRQYGLRLCWTVETHAHADHISGSGLLAEHAALKPPLRRVAASKRRRCNWCMATCCALAASNCARCTPPVTRRAA